MQIWNLDLRRQKNSQVLTVRIAPRSNEEPKVQLFGATIVEHLPTRIHQIAEWIQSLT